MFITIFKIQKLQRIRKPAHLPPPHVFLYTTTQSPPNSLTTKAEGSLQAKPSLVMNYGLKIFLTSKKNGQKFLSPFQQISQFLVSSVSSRTSIKLCGSKCQVTFYQNSHSPPSNGARESKSGIQSYIMYGIHQAILLGPKK